MHFTESFCAASAPPKPPSGRNGSSVTARTNQGEPDLDLTNGLDEIMASLDKLESNSASSNEGELFFKGSDPR